MDTKALSIVKKEGSDLVTKGKITPASFWLVVPPSSLVSRNTRPDYRGRIELTRQPVGMRGLATDLRRTTFLALYYWPPRSSTGVHTSLKVARKPGGVAALLRSPVRACGSFAQKPY